MSGSRSLADAGKCLADDPYFVEADAKRGVDDAVGVAHQGEYSVPLRLPFDTKCR